MFNNEIFWKNSGDLISSQCVIHFQLRAKLEFLLPAKKKWDNPCLSHSRTEDWFCRTQAVSQRIKRTESAQPNWRNQKDLLWKILIWSSDLLDGTGRFTSTLALKVKFYQVECEAEDILQLVIGIWMQGSIISLWNTTEDTQTRIS